MLSSALNTSLIIVSGEAFARLVSLLSVASSIDKSDANKLLAAAPVASVDAADVSFPAVLKLEVCNDEVSVSFSMNSPAAPWRLARISAKYAPTPVLLSSDEVAADVV